MRYKQKYTLYQVAKKDGKKVYYYRTYDENGKRSSGRSTGQTSKEAAHIQVAKLIQEGKLGIQKDKLTFEKYAENWWLWEKCPYIQMKIAIGGNISRDYADIARGYLIKHILPTFKKAVISKITTGQIETWRMKLKSEDSLSAKSINNICAILRKMLNEAERLDYISSNPMRKITALHEETVEKSFLSIEEVKRLVDPKHWDCHISYVVNMLAALTGIRLGEAIGLQSENVHSDHVVIEYSLSRKYGLKETKTRDRREIPLPMNVAANLLDLKANNPTGFIFSSDGGKTPIYYRTVTGNLYAALEKIDITDKIRRERGLSFHGWRHFFNTIMRSHGVPDSKLQKLTGHKTAAMVDHYTHYSKGDYNDVQLVQETIFPVSKEEA